MQKQDQQDQQNCNKHLKIKTHTYLREFINNLPYLLMIILGSIIFLISQTPSPWPLITGSLYFLYGIVGVFWIILFLCPYCHYYGTRLCPCGYGRIAAKLVSKKDGDRFPEKFKKHIPVIAPLWFLPVPAGGYGLWFGFSWVLLVLLVVFMVNSFIVLPLVSTKHGCAHCPQKKTCPWMKDKI